MSDRDGSAAWLANCGEQPAGEGDDLLACLLSSSQDGICILDSRLVIRVANAVFARQTGLTNEQLIGKPAPECVPGWAALEQVFHAARANGCLTRANALALPEAGSAVPLYYDVTVTPRRGAGGEDLGYLLLLRDVSEDVRTRQKMEDIMRALQAANEELLAQNEELRVARNEAQERLAQLATVFESTSAELALLDRDMNFIMVNSAYAANCGHAKEELIGCNHFALFPNPGNQAIFERVRDTGEPYIAIEKPFEYADQPERGVTYWNWTLVPVRDESGTVYGLVFSLLDVTPQVRARQRVEELAAEAREANRVLRESEERLRLATGAAQLGVFEWDVRTDHAVWENERMYEIFGRSRADGPLSGQALMTEVMHPDDVPEFRRMLALGQEHGQVFGVVCRIRRKGDDEWRWGAFSARFDQSADDSSLRLVGVVADVTDQKKAAEERERLLAQVQNRVAELDAILDDIADSVIIHDTDGRVMRMSRRAETVLGFTAEQWNASTNEERAALLLIEDESGRPLASGEIPMTLALRGETATDRHIVLHHPERGARHFIVNAGRIRDSQGKITGVVSSFTDISALVALQRSQQDFVRMISHDIRQPLTIIQGQGQWLKNALEKRQADERERRSAEAIVVSARRAGRMINDLVEASRLETGNIPLNPAPLDLYSLVLDIVQRLEGTSDSEQVRVEVPEEILPPVLADADRLERVLSNLISNAIKYSPEGAPVRVRFALADGGVITAVRDEGPGIAPDDLPHIFERYCRAKDAVQSPREGLGLGLYIARQIVESHGGRIWAESEPGRGSTFSFSLPLA